jgi:hypothetical protein
MGCLHPREHVRDIEASGEFPWPHILWCQLCGAVAYAEEGGYVGKVDVLPNPPPESMMPKNLGDWTYCSRPGEQEPGTLEGGRYP